MIMKLIGVYTESHKILKDEWFLPTLCDDYETELHSSPVSGDGSYMEDDWVEGIIFKSDIIIESIKNNRGDVIVYSDMDIQFFSPTESILVDAVKDNDIVCQRDDPWGNLCTGFFVARCNDKTLELWERVRSYIEIERRDQLTFNRIIREMTDVRFGYLPDAFFGAGTFTGQPWFPGKRFVIAANPIMHHANFAIGVDQKVRQLETARDIVRKGNMAIRLNNAQCRTREKWRFIKKGLLAILNG